MVRSSFHFIQGWWSLSNHLLEHEHDNPSTSFDIDLQNSLSASHAIFCASFVEVLVFPSSITR